MTPSANPPAPTEGAFIACLQGLQAGTSIDKFDYELAELVRAVRATKRKGKLTLTLTIRPKAKGGVMVLDNIKASPPKEEDAESFFYTDDAGRLLQNNPEGPNLPGLVILADEKKGISAPQPVVIAK